MSNQSPLGKKHKLWWIPALILLIVGYPVAVFGVLFIHIALFGLKGGPDHSTQVITTAVVAGLWSLMIALIFSRRLHTNGFWLAGIAFILWATVDIAISRPYSIISLPYAAVAGVVAWACFAKVYKLKKSRKIAALATVLAICICYGLFHATEKINYSVYSQRYSETTTLDQDYGPPDERVDIFYIDPQTSADDLLSDF